MDGKRAEPDEHCAKRPDRRPTRQAQHVRVGKRVSQQDLHQGTGEREQASGSKGGQRARQAQQAHHLLPHAGTANQRIEHLAQVHLHAAHGQRREQAHPGQRGQQHDHQNGAPGRHVSGYFGT